MEGLRNAELQREMVEHTYVSHTVFSTEVAQLEADFRQMQRLILSYRARTREKGDCRDSKTTKTVKIFTRFRARKVLKYSSMELYQWTKDIFEAKRVV